MCSGIKICLVPHAPGRLYTPWAKPYPLTSEKKRPAYGHAQCKNILWRFLEFGWLQVYCNLRTVLQIFYSAFADVLQLLSDGRLPRGTLEMFQTKLSYFRDSVYKTQSFIPNKQVLQIGKLEISWMLVILFIKLAQKELTSTIERSPLTYGMLCFGVFRNMQ